MNRLPATVSVDVDPVDLHLLGYGHRGLAPDPLVYTTALPRLVELFGRAGVRATFFVVGRDAPGHREAIAALTRAGHEVASHSQTHPVALARLEPDVLRHELVASRGALEEACGRPVIGFRAPSFDVSPAVIAALAAGGYRYDASGYPTPVLTLARIVLGLKGRDLGAALRLRMLPIDWKRDPHPLDHGITEFPVSVTPGFRLPVYHTARYAIGDGGFAAWLDGFVRRGETLSYPLHAVDALGLEEDGVDRRLAPHPGMNVPLEKKLALLERSLRAIAERFEPVPFQERLDGGGMESGART